MARKLKSDRILFLTTVFLAGLSLLMVYSASAARARVDLGDPYHFLTRQAMWALLGMGLLSAIMHIDYHLYRKPAFIWTLLAVVTAGLIAVFFMPATNNAHRWLNIGGLGVQPSEAAKLVAIIATAALLEQRMHRINDVKYALAPIVLVVGVLVALINREPDFGTAILVGLIVSVMILAAGVSYAYVFGLALAAAPAIAALIWLYPYRRRRLLAFLDPWQDPLHGGYQTIQSWIAVVTGGLWGRGLMNGVQQLFYLPEAHTDYIYAVITEEFGLLGATGVLLCFGILAWRGIRIAMSAPDSFGALLALGLTTMVVLQAFVNISVVVGLVPPKGIPLPFVSSGGSSLLVNFVGVGILLNVSQHTSSEA
jgi:cell division protein FtsW